MIEYRNCFNQVGRIIKINLNLIKNNIEVVKNHKLNPEKENQIHQ